MIIKNKIKMIARNKYKMKKIYIKKSCFKKNKRVKIIIIVRRRRIIERVKIVK